MHIYKYIHTYVYTYTYIHTNTHIHKCMCTYIHMNTDIHTYTNEILFFLLILKDKTPPPLFAVAHIITWEAKRGVFQYGASLDYMLSLVSQNRTLPRTHQTP